MNGRFLEPLKVDESYFGGRRKGKRGRGAAGKVPVFGILQREGKVYTKVIPDAKTQTILPIIREKVVPDSIVYTDYNHFKMILFNSHMGFFNEEWCRDHTPLCLKTRGQSIWFRKVE